jgi:two-component system, cell cycle response regulator DivK
MQSSCTTAAPARDIARNPAPGVLVLLVDDYQDCREMYAAYLNLAGFRVLKASDGLEALAIARRTVPDIVLMDLGLPIIDGFEATRRLKSDPVTRHIPVVALTAQSAPSAETLRTIGFDSVIMKPCLPDDLAERVERVVARSSEPPRNS